MAFKASKALIATVFGAAVLVQAAFAQVNPPSWWNQSDGMTSSFGWTFDANDFPPVPSTDLEPFGPPEWAKDGRTAWFDQVSDHSGVWGVPGGGDGTLTVTLKNTASDANVKHMWAQVDFFTEGGSQINPEFFTVPGSQIENLVTDSVDIGNGWKRGTATWDIVPQPDSEGVTFSFTTPVGADFGAYVDNFYIGSHCTAGVPSPAALLPFALGAIVAFRRRRR